MAKAAFKTDVRRDLHQEIVTAAALKEQVIAILGEENADAITLKDAIEGETNLLEMIDAVVLQIGEDEARVEGIKKLQGTLSGRSKRLDDRTDALRAMLTNALDMLGEKKLERPIATVTLKSTPPKLNIIDEPAIPSAYWKVPEPVLDRTGVKDALKARKTAMDELSERNQQGGLTQDQLDAARIEIEHTYPVIPGAELDNGGVTIQIRFS